MAHIVIMDEDDPSRKRYKVVYEVREKNGERKRRSKTFPAKTPLRKVKAYAREMEQKYDSSEGVDYTKRSLDDFAKEYFQCYTKELSPSTVMTYNRIYYSQVHGISMNLGRIELSNINTLQVQRFVNYLQDEGLSSKSIRNTIGVLHSMYDRAMKCRYVERGYNICGEVELPKMKKNKIQSYSAEDLKILLALTDKYASEELRFLIYLAIGTGARRSEMAAIRIEDVDLVNRIWHITSCKVCAGAVDIVKDPKTQAGIRDVPLGKTLCEEIQRMITRYEDNKKAQGSNFTDSRYLFSHPDTGLPFRTNTLTKWYIAFVQSHSDSIPYLPLHSLRHSYASLAVTNNLDVKTLQEILGHADSSTTLNIYSNSYNSSKRAYANKLEDIVFSDESD